MPRIVAYIKEMMEEERYGTKYIEKLPVRLQELNVAQLNGMYSHLTKIKGSATTKLWRNANGEIMSRMETILAEKNAIADAKQKRREQEILKRRQAREMARAKAVEAERVIQHIEEVARETAVEEIKEQEYQRKAAERIELMHKSIAAEKLRNTLLIRAAIFFVVTTTLLAVLVKNIIFAVVGIFGAACITGFVCWQAYLVSIVEPKVVTQEELDKKTEIRAEDLRLKAMNDLKQKEREFKARVLREKQERREIRRRRRELKMIHAALEEEEVDEREEEEDEDMSRAQSPSTPSVFRSGREGSDAGEDDEEVGRGQTLPLTESNLHSLLEANQQARANRKQQMQSGKLRVQVRFGGTESSDGDGQSPSVARHTPLKTPSTAGKGVHMAPGSVVEEEEGEDDLQAEDFGPLFDEACVSISKIHFSNMELSSDVQMHAVLLFSVLQVFPNGSRYLSEVMKIPGTDNDDFDTREDVDEASFSKLTMFKPSAQPLKEFVNATVSGLQATHNKSTPEVKEHPSKKSTKLPGTPSFMSSSFKFFGSAKIAASSPAAPVEESASVASASATTADPATEPKGEVCAEVTLTAGQSLHVMLYAVCTSMDAPHVMQSTLLCKTIIPIVDIGRTQWGAMDMGQVVSDLTPVDSFRHGTVTVKMKKIRIVDESVSAKPAAKNIEELFDSVGDSSAASRIESSAPSGISLSCVQVHSLRGLLNSLSATESDHSLTDISIGILTEDPGAVAATSGVRSLSKQLVRSSGPSSSGIDEYSSVDFMFSDLQLQIRSSQVFVVNLYVSIQSSSSSASSTSSPDLSGERLLGRFECACTDLMTGTDYTSADGDQRVTSGVILSSTFEPLGRIRIHSKLVL